MNKSDIKLSRLRTLVSDLAPTILVLCLHSTGQWAPIVGTGLAVLGSLYLLIASAMDEEQNSGSPPSLQACNCEHYHSGRGGDELQRHPTAETTPDSIRKIASGFIKISNYISNPALTRFDDSDLQRGRATDYPEIPGEVNRNRNLSKIRTQYSEHRGSDANEGSRSRADSGATSIHSSHFVTAGAEMYGDQHLDGNIPTQSRASIESAGTRLTSSATTSAEGIRVSPTSPTTPRRRDTLEVPSPVQFSASRNPSSGSGMIQVTSPLEPSVEITQERRRDSQNGRRSRRQSGRQSELPSTPAIVISPNADTPSPTITAADDPLSPPRSSLGLRLPSPTTSLPPR